MFGVGLPEIAVGTALLMLLFVVLPELGLRRVGRSVRVRREWRLVQVTRVAGVVAGVVLADAVGSEPLWAPVFGLVVVATVALGETVVRPRRPPGARVASLGARRVGDYLPRRLGLGVLALVVALAAVSVTSLLVLRPGRRPGAVVVRGCSTDAFSYDVPVFVTPALVLTVLATLALAVVAARQVVVRPRGMAEDVVDDDALRRRSLTVVVAAVGLGTAPVLNGSVVTLLDALESGADCGEGWGPGLEVLGTVVVVWCLGSTLYYLLELLVGRAARPLAPARSDEPAGRGRG